jgi:Asp/Glu/hydantoin racemase
MPPIEMVAYRYPLRLADMQVIDNIITAEREGYDAVAISCFLDPGLEEARSMVSIPVASSCETALLVSSAVARSFGFVTLNEAMAVYLRELVDQYGFGERVKTIAAMDPPIDEHELDLAFAGSPAFVERFSRDASRTLGKGVEIIIPAEGVVNIALVRNKVRAVGNAPVLDSYGSLLGFAEMMVQLQRKSGLKTSRLGAYAAPPQGLVPNLRGIAADILSQNNLAAE